MIEYTETYEIITEESAAIGQVTERGISDKNASGDFHGMVDTLAGTEPSCSDLDSGYVWFTLYGSNDGTREFYETGCVENRSYHPKTDRDARYMIKAWRTANQNQLY